jgi:ATP-dependent Clp protease ATP-binding subunit ClpA
VTPEFIGVALIAGLAGGAIAAVVMGAIQAWMGRAKGSRIHYAVGVHPPSFDHAAQRPQAGLGWQHAMVRLDRLGEAGKRVLALAQDEAVRHNHNYIGTEHLLSALMRGEETIASRALTSFGVELAKVRTSLEFIIGRGDQTTSPSEITLSPRTKKVLELAIMEAERMGQPQVGPEHFLLALVDEGQGIASGILESLGVRLETLRAKVLELLKESGAPVPEGYTPPSIRRHETGPFVRFSNRAKRAVALAQDEAVRMGHGYIGPEHLLLGLARLPGIGGQDDQAMKRIFDELGLTLEQLRAELAEIIPPVEPRTPATEIVLSPETKQIVELLAREPGEPTLPEHLLLAIVREEESFAVQILTRLGVTGERVRAAVGH